jgi:hypothetical protein
MPFCGISIKNDTYINIYIYIIVEYDCSTDVEIVFYAPLTGAGKERLRKKEKKTLP